MATTYLEQLLLQAGDVEMNPGPKDRPTKEYSDQDFDSILQKVAEEIQKDTDIYNLGRKLEFGHSEIKRYMEANKIGNTVTYMGTLDMLHDWKKKTKRYEEREKLKEALIEIGHVRLADDLPNDYVARISDTSLGSTVFASPRPSSSTSAATPVQDASTAAGEVFTARASDTVSDWELTTLTAHVPIHKYYKLSDKLGIWFDEASRILKQHGSNYEEAMRKCLSIWKNKTGGSFTELESICYSIEIGGIWRQYVK